MQKTDYTIAISPLKLFFLHLFVFLFVVHRAQSAIAWSELREIRSLLLSIPREEKKNLYKSPENNNFFSLYTLQAIRYKHIFMRVVQLLLSHTHTN